MAVGGVAESPLYDGEHSWSKSPHPRQQSCSSLTLSTAPQTGRMSPATVVRSAGTGPLSEALCGICQLVLVWGCIRAGSLDA